MVVNDPSTGVVLSRLSALTRKVAISARVVSLVGQ